VLPLSRREWSPPSPPRLPRAPAPRRSRQPRCARRELAQKSGRGRRREPGQQRREGGDEASLLALSLEPRLRRLIERHRKNPSHSVPEGPTSEAVAHRIRHRKITEKEAHSCAAE